MIIASNYSRTSSNNLRAINCLDGGGLMLKQQSQILSRKIDSIYYNGPDQAEKDVNKLESYLENLRNAERDAREKHEAAVKAAREAAEIKKIVSST